MGGLVGSGGGGGGGLGKGSVVVRRVSAIIPDYLHRKAVRMGTRHAVFTAHWKKKHNQKPMINKKICFKDGILRLLQYLTCFQSYTTKYIRTRLLFGGGSGCGDGGEGKRKVLILLNEEVLDSIIKCVFEISDDSFSWLLMEAHCAMMMSNLSCDGCADSSSRDSDSSSMIVDPVSLDKNDMSPPQSSSSPIISSSPVPTVTATPNNSLRCRNGGGGGGGGGNRMTKK
ncbi:hypothetical protein M0802_017028, partial [Mischocyttarus mexicanus]